jgi:ABC-type uncharacterized transport system fused permease/ATPase subunit
MQDELILNPTSYLLLISVCVGIGYLIKHLEDKFINWLNKYYYIKD